MSKGAASETELGALHKKVATVLGKVLDNVDKAQEAYSHLDFEVVDYVPPPEVPASVLTVATKFLNDNKITCQPEESAELSDLERKLANNRQKRRQVGNVVHLTDDE
jgi:hypothetical protein